MKRSHKPLPRVEIISYGQYSGWNSHDKELPELVTLTDRVTATADVEFGLIVEIRQAKGRYIQYIIEHPPFRDENDVLIPPFTGEYQIRTNPARFFLGDSLGFPFEEKKGIWVFKILLDEKILAEKKLVIF
ncbi:MAG: DUF3859 domain-containing protein [Cyclobacteriaceae bacterium]|nr:DUF3859 domain-containing protein [Cyclobacteriaceae bacterium]